MMVGVPPYSPGDYINIDYEGDTVDVWFAPYFTRPLRLTAAEGLALLAAGRALLAVPGSDEHGPLATALDKLEARARACPRSSSTSRRPTTSTRCASRGGAGERIEIDYWSAGRDALTTREIDPGPPFFALGEWYTDAYDHLRGEPRMFRVDRIRAVRSTGETFTPVPAGPRGAVYNPRPDDRRVTARAARHRRAGSRRASRPSRSRSCPTAGSGSCSRSARTPGSSACCSGPVPTPGSSHRRRAADIGPAAAAPAPGPLPRA